MEAIINVVNVINALLSIFKEGSLGVSIIWKKDMTGISPILDCSHDRICGVRVRNTLGSVLISPACIMNE